jgi:hypothetical protein
MLLCIGILWPLSLCPLHGPRVPRSVIPVRIFLTGVKRIDSYSQLMVYGSGGKPFWTLGLHSQSIKMGSWVGKYEKLLQCLMKSPSFEI